MTPEEALQEAVHQIGGITMTDSRPVADDLMNMLRRLGFEIVQGWQPIEKAPRNGFRFLAEVDREVRLVAWGKASHMPLYGFHLDDQGAEDCDLCEPTMWRPMPELPSADQRACAEKCAQTPVTSPAEEGRSARRAGRNRNSNPYCPEQGVNAWEEWDDAWAVAGEEE